MSPVSETQVARRGANEAKKFRGPTACGRPASATICLSLSHTDELQRDKGQHTPPPSTMPDNNENEESTWTSFRDPYSQEGLVRGSPPSQGQRPNHARRGLSGYIPGDDYDPFAEHAEKKKKDSCSSVDPSVNKVMARYCEGTHRTGRQPVVCVCVCVDSFPGWLF